MFILFESLSQFELEETGRFIRHHWPRSKILVLRNGEDFLDDPLYDERVPVDISDHDLIETIETLLREANK